MIREHFLTIREAALWRKYLPASRSVFGSVEYAKISETFRGGFPRLYILQSDAAYISHPMLLRPVSDLPFVAEVGGKWDSTTPEYTGPTIQGSDDDLVARFNDCYSIFNMKQGVIAEFAHLHPWSDGVNLLGEGCTYNRDIVWVDVTQSPEQLFQKTIVSSCRNKIKNSRRESVRIIAESDDDAIREFYRIYVGTMRRNQALEKYYFPLEFFKKIRDDLPENARFTLAEHSGKIIAAYLLMHDNNDVFSFLGGMDAEFSYLHPTNLVNWETMLWAHEAGKKRFILGGGYRPNDGVFKFKSSFSPLRQPFYVYKRIHRPEDYAILDRCSRKYSGMEDKNVEYFPSYRYIKNS
jgi:hypothetical protein